MPSQAPEAPTLPGMRRPLAFSVAALALLVLGGAASWSDAAPAMAAPGFPIWMRSVILTLAAGFLAAEMPRLGAAAPAGPATRFLMASLPAAMGIAELADRHTTALLFEFAASIGLWIFLSVRASALRHGRHPGPALALTGTRLLAAGCVAALMGKAGLIADPTGGAMHAAAFDGFFVLFAIACIRWSGNLGLRSGRSATSGAATYAAIGLFLASLGVEAAIDAGGLGARAWWIAVPLRTLVLYRFLRHPHGIHPVLPGASWFVTLVGLGLALDVAGVATHLAPLASADRWAAWLRLAAECWMAGVLCGAALNGIARSLSTRLRAAPRSPRLPRQSERPSRLRPVLR